VKELVRVENLAVSYNSSIADAAPRALDGVSFTIERGEKIALIGDNGAGKSTLLLALAGALPPCGGTIEIDGVQLRKDTLGEIRQKAGIVFQNPDDQFFMPTVEEDVAFGPRNLRLDEAALAARLNALLERLGIAALRSRPALELSGGEKRLVALAGVLIMEPELLLLDEPTSFLDLRARRNLIAILQQLPQAALIATHDLDFARALCNRVIHLEKGRVSANGPAKTLLQDIGGLNKLLA
jgi:cobalt/nickel transport system ATP-binding protein